jgi:predicted ATPase
VFEQQSENSLYVLTGGPGAGKTTLIDALERAGFARSVEVGRQIIQEQMAIGGRALPWCDPELFAELMLSREMQAYTALRAQQRPVFCDRGIPDVLGYLRVTGRAIPPYMRAAAERMRYNRFVFIVPPWPEIYDGDTERKQTLDEAIRTHAAMADVYTELGYALIEVPKALVAERVDFVVHHIYATQRDSR